MDLIFAIYIYYRLFRFGYYRASCYVGFYRIVQNLQLHLTNYVNLHQFINLFTKNVSSNCTFPQYGISGAYWYAAGASIQLLIFSIITVQLKIKAPGAKTYLQIIRARFDKKTHLTFCAFALMTNFVVTAMLMLGERACMRVINRSMMTIN